MKEEKKQTSRQQKGRGFGQAGLRQLYYFLFRVAGVEGKERRRILNMIACGMAISVAVGGAVFGFLMFGVVGGIFGFLIGLYVGGRGVEDEGYWE